MTLMATQTVCNPLDVLGDVIYTVTDIYIQYGVKAIGHGTLYDKER